LRIAGELGPGIDAELLIDVVQMHLDRSLADEEFLADLRIAQTQACLLDDQSSDRSGRCATIRRYLNLS